MEMPRYRMCGLTLASCVELPGAKAETDDPADALVQYGAVPAALADTSYRGPNWEAGARRVLLRAPGIAQFLIADGREVSLQPAPGRTPAELAVFLTGSVLGALLHQRGAFVLHASAVAVDGEAVLFCGPSGGGKSVLAASLAAAGYPLIADEICALACEGGRPAVVSDGRRLKLWADTIARLRLQERKRAPVRPGFEKYWVEPPVFAGAAQVPLRGIYFLHRQQLPATSGLQRLALLDAVTMLRAHAYRRRLIPALGREQSWLDISAAVAGRVAAWHLIRKLDFDLLPETRRLLEQHWSSG